MTERTALELAQPIMQAENHRPLAYLFHALAHEKRLQIIQLLDQRGPTTLADLRDALDGRGDAWEHIKVLKAAGLVRLVGAGKLSRWELVPGSLKLASRVLLPPD